MSGTSPHNDGFVWRDGMPVLRLRVLDFQSPGAVLEDYCCGAGVAVFSRGLSSGSGGTMVIYETEVDVPVAVDGPEFGGWFAGTVCDDIGCGAEDERGPREAFHQRLHRHHLQHRATPLRPRLLPAT